MTWYLLPRSSLCSRVPPPLLGVPYCACATDPPGSPPPVFGSPITIHIISTKRLIGSRRNKGVCLPRQPPTVRPWAWGPWAACQPSLIIKSVKNALGKRVRHLRSNLSNLASFIISVYTSILLYDKTHYLLHKKDSYSPFVNYYLSISIPKTAVFYMTYQLPLYLFSRRSFSSRI